MPNASQHFKQQQQELQKETRVPENVYVQNALP